MDPPLLNVSFTGYELDKPQQLALVRSTASDLRFHWQRGVISQSTIIIIDQISSGSVVKSAFTDRCFHSQAL